MKVQYIYTVEVADDMVPGLQQALEEHLCKPLESADRKIVTHVMGQVIEQLKQMPAKNIGSGGACAAMIQHCCLMGVVAMGDQSVIRFRVLPDENGPIPNRHIIWN